MTLILKSKKVKDELFGFHVQQAAEKLLKSVLASRRIRYRYTHDLVELIDILKASGVDIIPEVEQVCIFTPFAVEYRYDYLPSEEEAPFDRKGALTLLKTIRYWAENTIAETRSGK